MKKQYILLGTSSILLLLLFFFARRTSDKANTTVALLTNSTPLPHFSIEKFIVQEKAKLAQGMLVQLTTLENEVKSNAALGSQVKSNYALANFWKDSVKVFEPYAFYYSTASKLENSEKNLTFAARLYLSNLRNEQIDDVLAWKTSEAISLFNKAIILNPSDDELKIDLGSAYIYGKGRTGNPAETMEGIKTLLDVARKDTNNMRAQLMLGVGGVLSGQYDKAIDRLIKVTATNPNSVEAVAYLADAYAGKGNKAEAIKWYNISKRLINDKHYTEEVDERIKKLK